MNERVGLDLTDPRIMGLVHRLYFSRLVVLVDDAGADREEGLQELVKRLLERQRRRGSSYQASRGSAATYLYRAGRSAMQDWLRGERRRRVRDGEPAEVEDAALHRLGELGDQEARVWLRERMEREAACRDHR